MFPTIVIQDRAETSNTNVFGAALAKIEVQPDEKVADLLANLAPDTPWAERQVAARELGGCGNPDAVLALIAALPADPFWMVRCAIIQALEMIGDAAALPTLRDVAGADDFEVVRACANQAIEGLTR